ncbi:hypothetical protein SVAN01_02129 [Stagonosporopsis vannaccii]|nr:hypothetical protein SVAN01_02129 [Stagonosporopsis vannaccii]
MDLAPTAPLPAASKWEPQPGSARLAGRASRLSRLATQSKPHDKPLVNSFEAEKISNLPLQMDRADAAEAPSNSPPKPHAPGYRLP